MSAPTHKAAPPFTYAELARLITAGDDPRFLIRQLREVAIRSARETDQSVLDTIHAEPRRPGQPAGMPCSAASPP